MGRNLKYQFYQAIEGSFERGVDKHAVKRDIGLGTDRIYSDKDKRNLIDTSALFAKFLKEQFPDIKLVKKIKPRHIQSFIDKAAETCSEATVKQYMTRLTKLSKIVNARYGIHTSFQCTLPVTVKPGKIRTVAMTRSDLAAICARGRESQSKNAVLLTAECGLRVNSLVNLQVRDVDFEKMVLHVYKDKGGRSRDVKLNDTAISLLDQFCDGKRPKQYLFTGKDGKGHICGDTVNKFLRDNAKRCGITRYADSKTGVHCIRKMHAQELYKAAIESGMSHKQALWEVTLDLGHSSIRMEVLEAYLNTDFEGEI